MTPTQFAALTRLMRLRDTPTTEGLRLVLVEGLTRVAAAEKAGAHQPHVSRLVNLARQCVADANLLAGAIVPGRWERTHGPAKAARAAS